MEGKRVLRKIALRSLVGMSAALVIGCGNDDDGGTGPGSSNVDQATAQQQATVALEFVDGMLANVDEMANGNFGGLGAPFAGLEPVWDAASESWILTSTYTDQSGSYSWSWGAQFLAGGSVLNSGSLQSDASSADAANLSQSAAIDASFTTEQSSGTTSLDYDNQLAVTGLVPDGGRGGETLTVTGNGSMAVDISGTNQGTSYDYDFSMSWAMDVTVSSLGGCPSGTVSVTVDRWSVMATYDAQTSTYTWVMTENGSPVAQQTVVSGCS